MRKTILTIAAILIANFTFGQLNSKAKFFQEKAPEIYKDIRYYAVQEWGVQDDMVIYTINKESDALHNLMMNYSDYVNAEKGSKKHKQYMIALSNWTKEYSKERYYTVYSMVVYELKKFKKNKDY